MINIAIIGNPNSGKTSIFNHLTGLHQKVGNFPGVTVEKKEGSCTTASGFQFNLIDFPGAYSLHARSFDERVVLAQFANPHPKVPISGVIYVADIAHLEKHLLLMTQICDLGYPVIMALSMADLADGEAANMDVSNLSSAFNVPVVLVNGRTGDGKKELNTKLEELLKRSSDKKQKAFYDFSESEKNLIAGVQDIWPGISHYQALLLAHHSDGLPFISESEKGIIKVLRTQEDFDSLDGQVRETMERYDRFLPAFRRFQQQIKQDSNSITDKIDRWVTHGVIGPFIFFGLMLIVFQAIFAWAEKPMEWIESLFGFAQSFFGNLLPAGWVHDLIVEGIIPGIGGIMVFIPQIAILFFIIAILDELGYMARAVFLFDKIMQHFGLNGRSMVALISGGACAIPAIMSARNISNWKERLITILVTPLISCSARIPVYIILIGLAIPSRKVLGVFNLQGLAFTSLYLISILAALLSAYVFKRILKSKEQSFLMIELPTYKFPYWKNVLYSVKEKVLSFIWEAGKVILLISVLLWFAASYGPSDSMSRAEQEATRLAQQQDLNAEATADLVSAKKLEASYAGRVGKTIEPAIEPLGFDWKIGIALITSFAAREVFVGTMATLYSIGSEEDEFKIQERLASEVNPHTGQKVYTIATALSLIVFYLFAMQCMSTLAVVKKETRTWKWPIIQFVFMSVLAYLGSLLVYQIFS